MEKFYMNIKTDVERILFKYKNKIILIINKKEICPDTNTSQ